MFNKLVKDVTGVDAKFLSMLHPWELSALMEYVWGKISRVKSVDLGHPDRRSEINGLETNLLNNILSKSLTSIKTYIDSNELKWHHLIYAYMIENTRIYEIFRRVLHEFMHGEKFGPAHTETQCWLRNTEELFYHDPPPFSIFNITSHIRSDMRASRRNAYWRMLGMDLNHGTDDGQPYPYVKAEATNSAFVTTFEELLRELWIGHTYCDASAAAKPTDDSKIYTLVTQLRDMLTARRRNGSLSREEFAFVTMMSWFHMSVSTNDLKIIEDLRAEASSAEQRLFKIAERVGLPAHGLSKSLFEIAEPLSAILTSIEADVYKDTETVKALYSPADDSQWNYISTIITHWSIITGRDMKAGKVAVK